MSAGRVGVFGGTFDPPHVGHRIVASDVCEGLSLDRLIVVPAARPPHREAELPARVRLDLARAAFAGDRRVEVDDIEFRREGPSYMVETLEQIRSSRPGDRLFLVIGADQYDGFGAWRDADRIVGMAELAVMRRDGRGPRPDERYPFQRVDVTRVDVSSTEIRRRLSEGLSVRYLVPDVILEDLVLAWATHMTLERPMGFETRC